MLSNKFKLEFLEDLDFLINKKSSNLDIVIFLKKRHNLVFIIELHVVYFFEVILNVKVKKTDYSLLSYFFYFLLKYKKAFFYKFLFDDDFDIKIKRHGFFYWFFFFSKFGIFDSFWFWFDHWKFSSRFYSKICKIWKRWKKNFLLYEKNNKQV